jgi:nucleotide-binding universal stress UspA family protein
MTTATTAQPAIDVSLQHILVASDLSRCSHAALQHALGLAHGYGSHVYLFHAVSALGFDMAGPEAWVEAVDCAWRDARRLETELFLSRQLEGIRFNVIVRQGDLWPSLARVVKQHDIDLIVVGTHARGRIRKLLLGSVAETIFRHATCPVLTINPSLEQSLHGIQAPRRILFPTDFSPQSQYAAAHAISLARRCGAHLTLLHVLPEMTGEAGGDRERVIEVTRGRLRALVNNVDVPVSCRVVEANSAVDAILRCAAAEADLIVSGVRAPQSILERLTWSNAYRIVTEASCPVLTVRAPASCA